MQHCFAEIRQGYVRLTKNAPPAVPDNTEVEEFNIPEGTYGAVYTGVSYPTAKARGLPLSRGANGHWASLIG